MKTVIKHKWYQTMSGVGVATLVVLAGCASIPPPTEQIAVTKAAVDHAASVGGAQYASADMRAAQDKLARANQAMTAEDYGKARVLAEEAQVDAQLAAAKAGSAKAQRAAAAVQTDSEVLRKEIDRKRQ